MHLVNDIHTVFQLCRQKRDLFLEVTHVINAVVARRVHLDHVRCAAAFNASAGITLVAGVSVSRILAIYRLGKNLGTARFSRSARAAEEISMRYFILRHLVFEDIRGCILTANIVKIHGAPFSVKRAIIRHRCLPPEIVSKKRKA